MKKPELRIVLMAGDTKVAEYHDAELWRSLLASRTKTKQALALGSRVPQESSEACLARLVELAVFTEEEAAFVVRVVESVAAEYNIAAELLRGPSRVARVALARSVSMYILRSHSMLTLPAIAAYFDRHHTTVLSAITEIEKRIFTDPDLGTFIGGIATSLGLQPYQ